MIFSFVRSACLSFYFVEFSFLFNLQILVRSRKLNGNFRFSFNYENSSACDLAVFNILVSIYV